MDDTVTLLYVE